MFVTYLDAVSTVDLTANELEVYICITIKPSPRFVRINKLDRDNLYWQILENLSFTYTANGKR